MGSKCSCDCGDGEMEVKIDRVRMIFGAYFANRRSYIREATAVGHTASREAVRRRMSTPP